MNELCPSNDILKAVTRVPFHDGQNKPPTHLSIYVGNRGVLPTYAPARA